MRLGGVHAGAAAVLALQSDVCSMVRLKSGCEGLSLLVTAVQKAMRGAGAPCSGLPVGERPQVEADWAALSAALMSACGSGAQT